jgi:hypothetical protein
MEVLRCSCWVLGCGPSLLDSVPQTGRPCQAPSRRSVSSGAVLALSARVAIEVRDGAVHSCDASLLDLRAAVWTDGCVGGIGSGDDQFSVGLRFSH